MTEEVLMYHAPVPVFFSNAMVATDGASFSPSASKPAQVVASWQRLWVPLDIIAPTAATVDELAEAHDRTYVEEVLACRRANGFGNRAPGVAAALPYTSGAMLSAARHVLATGAPIAVAPCSGFHHASWDHGAGFCTFNGLMVTAATLRAEGRVKRVGILDLDYHYGDGTDDIMHHLDAWTWVHHYTSGGRHTDRDPARFFAELPAILGAMRDCDIVLYQAGADAHIDDPLGGWMTTAQLRERDMRVLGGLVALGVPVVWNLAGGYQRDADGGLSKVLEIHDNTMLATSEALMGAVR